MPTDHSFEIAGRRIGAGEPPWIIAEIGINHEGDVAVARELIRACAAAGADAIKFQIVFADTLYPPEQWGGEWHTLFKSTELTEAEYLDLAHLCRELNIVPFASFNDASGVDIAERWCAPVYKIASTQMTNTPLVRHAASKKMPLIISTGMAALGEIEVCLAAARDAGATDIALLHCVSNYPTSPKDVNLLAMNTLGGAFGLPIGFSDHSDGLLASTLAAGAAACVIERHVSLDSNREGYDHQISLTPPELKKLVDQARTAHAMRGTGDISERASEKPFRGDYRTSLAAARDIAAGTVIEPAMLIGMRPGNGLPPHLWTYVVGKPAPRTMKRGELFRFRDIPDP